MTFGDPGETLLAALERDTAHARVQTIADLFLHPVLMEHTTANLDQIPQLIDHGCNTRKFFMASPGFVAHIQSYLEATRRAGASGLLTLIHCEDSALIADATAALVAAGKTTLHAYAASRPVIAEVIATQRAVAVAEATGASLYCSPTGSQSASLCNRSSSSVAPLASIPSTCFALPKRCAHGLEPIPPKDSFFVPGDREMADGLASD
jgi:dihydroorotase-like cyclic amidohydrolase